MYQTKNHQSLRASLLVGVASATVMAFAGTAVAQEAAPDIVVVTGSRLPQNTNLTTVSPVTSITSEDIANSGATRLEDIVNQLPQAFAAQNATVSNGATGTATLNLRGLGEVRTLVLVDGRRMPYGSPFSPAADINEIPGIMVERVEVLTGGASAVYGSDAIAGVVNFIMRKDFEGVQVDLGYDFYWHNNDYDGPGNLRAIIEGRHATNPSQFNLPDDSFTDGDGHEESIIMGVNSGDGKGNITAYFTHRKTKPILQANRDYSSCSLSTALPGFKPPPAPPLTPNTNFACGGSGTSFPGEFTDFTNYYYTVSSTAVGPNGFHNQFRNFNGTTDQFNFGPINYYQRPDERYSFGAFGHYEVASYAEIYGSLMFTDYRTRSQIAPSGDFFGTNAVNCDNPLLSAQQEGAICEGLDPSGALVRPPLVDPDPITPGNQAVAPMYIGRRNVEGGGRIDDLHYLSYRVNGGVRGTISQHWGYDLNAQIAKVQLSETYLNDFSKTRLARALDVHDVGGTPTCQSVIDGTDPDCVPYNIFTLGGVDRAQLGYLQIPLLRNATVEQQMINLTFLGDLPAIQSPWAENDMALAFGAEYRYDKVDNQTDVAFQTGDGAGQGGPSLPLSGASDVLEVFMETKIPIVENAPFMKELSFEGAYRFSHYSTGVATDTYKLAGNWSPTEDFRIRGAYQRAVRAPNVLELFSAQGFNLFDMGADPCGGPTPSVSQAACASTPGAGGAPWYGNNSLQSPAGQYNFLGGGNPNLGPETSDTRTVGLVLTPTFLNGFNASIDWFDIKVLDLITAIGPETILNQCYSGNASQCSRIHRNALGQLWVGTGFVESLNTNIGGLRTKGIDINVNYRTEIDEGWGAISFNLVGTWLDELSSDDGLNSPAVAPGPTTGAGHSSISLVECVGFYGSACGTPNPEWRHRLRVAWEVPMDEWNPVISFTWRRYSEVRLFNSNPNTFGHGNHSTCGLIANPPGVAVNEPGDQGIGCPDRLSEQFPAENYFDIGFTADIATGTSFRMGINNIFDKDPPLSGLVGTTGNGNTYPQTYDAFGRYVFAGVTINL